MLEAHAFQETAFDRTDAPTSSVDLVGATPLSPDVSVHERIVEAKRLVQCACRALGNDSSQEPFGLRLARALVLNLLDELSVLDNRWGR